MRDLDSGETLNFSCHRWLARDEDDQEITRELAVKRPGESILPCEYNFTHPILHFIA